MSYIDELTASMPVVKVEAGDIAILDGSWAMPHLKEMCIKACAEVDRLRSANAKLEQELKDAREAANTNWGAANYRLKYLCMVGEALGIEYENKPDSNPAAYASKCAEVARKLTVTESRLAALERDGERLDAIPHGWRIGHEVGASGYPDHWYIWTTDWSQPLGEGTTLREALDAAQQADAAPGKTEGGGPQPDKTVWNPPMPDRVNPAPSEGGK